MNREELLKVSKPILFNTEMVQAILGGRKTVTRRVIKKKYSNTDIEWFTNKYGKRLVEMQNDVPEPIIHEDGSRTIHIRACEGIKQPYQVGDILYVRETWQESECFDYAIKNKYCYRANDGDREFAEEHNIRWRPSIHMPKEAARIFLKVTDIRVERLQDITEEQAEKEGFISTAKIIDDGSDYTGLYADEHFINAWDSIYATKGYGLYANPWVWVIEFERIEVK